MTFLKNSVIEIIKGRYKYVIVIALLAGAILPFLLLSFFAFPSLDDYWMLIYHRYLREENVSVWRAIAEQLTSVYTSFGVAPNVFISFLFLPLLQFGIAGIRIINFCMNILFLFSTFVFIKWVLKGVFKDANSLHWLTAYFLYVICFISFCYQSEIFAWTNVTLCYLFPVSCLHLGLAFWIRASLFKNVRFWTLSAVFGVLGAMGTLHIAALVCGLYVASLLLLLINKKSTRSAVFIVFVVVAVGASILFTPGLYKRHDIMSSEYNWLVSLKFTVNCIWLIVKTFLYSPIAIVLCLFAILASKWFVFSKPIHWMNVALAFVLAVLSPVIVLFPYCFGYGVHGQFMTPRVRFVADMTIIICGLFVIFCATAFVKSRMPHSAVTKASMLPLIIVLALFCGNIAFTCHGLYDSGGSKSFLPLMVVRDISSGQLAKTNTYWDGKIKEWGGSEGQDVVVDMEEQDANRLPYLMYPTVARDPDYFGNVEIADFYHLNSIRGVLSVN